MKEFAVGYINWFDNDLIIEIIRAENWKKALFKHSRLQSDDWNQDDFGDTLEDAKSYAFNCDMMIEVTEI